MKIEYLHKGGGLTHQGPSGLDYTFAEDRLGRQIAEVTYGIDQERFLSLMDAKGQPLFICRDEPIPARSRKAAELPPKE